MQFVCSRAWDLRVQDILKAIAAIQRHTANISLEEFIDNEVLVQAVLYNYIIIGEATRNIPPEIQTLSPETPWRIMSDMRNVMAHEYFRVNLEIVWDGIQTDLPLLVPQLQELLNRATQAE
jgi:uncharacterized protein with HEPN domain